MVANSNLSEGTYVPEELLAGSEQVVTDQGTLITGQNLAKYTVLGRIAASGKLTVFTPGASDGSQNACAILAEACDATSVDKACQIYIGGTFNHAILVWPAAIDTVLERQAAFSRSPIAVKVLFQSAPQ